MFSLGSCLPTYLVCWALSGKRPTPIYQAHYSNHPTLLAGCDSSATRRDPHPTCPLSPYERHPKSAQPAGSPTGTISSEHATSRKGTSCSTLPPCTPPAGSTERCSASPASVQLQQTPGAIPALGIGRKSRHGETRPPAPIIHQPPCWARSPSPRQRLDTTAAAPDGGRRRLAAAPACHPVGDRGGCRGAAGGWRRMSAGPEPLHLPMVRHWRKEAGRKLAGRLGGASSRDA